MRKILFLALMVMLNACTTEYILMDENNNPVKGDTYTSTFEEEINGISSTQFQSQSSQSYRASRAITAKDVFVVDEGVDYVVYQYKNTRVDEISPLASLYCNDAEPGSSSFLREVNMYHNGFMRATFDCVALAN